MLYNYKIQKGQQHIPLVNLSKIGISKNQVFALHLFITRKIMVLRYNLDFSWFWRPLVETTAATLSVRQSIFFIFLEDPRPYARKSRSPMSVDHFAMACD